MAEFEGIDHIDIVVKDPDAMAEFFLRLGFAMVRRAPPSRGSIELRFPGGEGQPVIELTPAHSPSGKEFPLGLRHMAIRSSDSSATHAMLSEQGFSLSGAPRKVADTGRTVFSVIDPEGNPLQITD